MLTQVIRLSHLNLVALQPATARWSLLGCRLGFKAQHKGIIFCWTPQEYLTAEQGRKPGWHIGSTVGRKQNVQTKGTSISSDSEQQFHGLAPIDSLIQLLEGAEAIDQQ